MSGDTFVYKLNAMEIASRTDNPAEHGYGTKREAVLQHVAKLTDENKRLTARVKALAAALRRCVERECYCAEGQHLLNDFECASCEGKRALAQRSERAER